MSKSSSSSSGVGFFGLLTIVFITLKLLDITVVATWSWWWVLSPAWISASIVILILAVLGIVYLWPEKKNKVTDLPKYEAKKSAFMEKLDAAMAESEKRRNEKNN